MSEQDDIDFGRLADWVEGRLSGEEAENVAQRVANAGEETRARVEWLRAFARASGETQLSAPPREVRELLSRRFVSRARANAEEREPGLLRRVVAALSFDSGLQAAAGVRSADVQGAGRQLVYSTGGADIAIDLHERPQDKRLDLDCQVLIGEGEGTPSFDVRLLRDGGEIAATTSDDVGDFTFEAIAPGEYEMVFSGEEVEIVLSPVELRV